MLTLVSVSVGIALALWAALFFFGSLFEKTGARGVIKKETTLADAALQIFGLAILTFVVIWFFQQQILATASTVYTWASGVLEKIFSGTAVIDIMPGEQIILIPLPILPLLRKIFRK